MIHHALSVQNTMNGNNVLQDVGRAGSVPELFADSRESSGRVTPALLVPLKGGTRITASKLDPTPNSVSKKAYDARAGNPEPHRQV